MDMNSQSGPAPRIGLSTPVWVDLTALYRLPVDESRDGELLPRLGQELDLGGEVAGTLHEWIRSARGLWIGVVSFAALLAEDRSKWLDLRRQLVPAYALRPRPEPSDRKAR
jgi:hypothetical protein